MLGDDGSPPSRAPWAKSAPAIFRRLWEGGTLERRDGAALAWLDWSRQTLAPRASFDCGDDLCILSSGLAFRQRPAEAGASQPISLVLPGDICCYTGVTGHAAQSSLVSVVAASVMRAPSRSVAALCERHPKILAAMLSNLATDNETAEELLISIGRRSALERVAHLFCELEFRLRRMGLARNGRYRLNLTQADIGAYLALSAVHVNRTIQELRRRGLVSGRGGDISLPDLGALRRLCGFSPAYLAADTLSEPRPVPQHLQAAVQAGATL